MKKETMEWSTRPTPRGDMLTRVAELVEGNRNRSHGDPEPQLNVAGTLKELLRTHAVMQLENAEWEAIEMICTKLSRLVMGHTRNLDNPMDIAGYASILYEVMHNIEQRTPVDKPERDKE